jgi:hypothetical protein
VQPGFGSRQRRCVHIDYGAHPTSCPMVSPEVKWLGLEADHSLPSSAEVTMV